MTALEIKSIARTDGGNCREHGIFDENELVYFLFELGFDETEFATESGLADISGNGPDFFKNRIVQLLNDYNGGNFWVRFESGLKINFYATIDN